jgi:uncharacterized membrane protein
VPYPQYRTSDDIVAPTLADPLARAGTVRIGGPIGRHNRAGAGWWTALRITLLMATVCFGLGIVQKSPCVVTDFGEVQRPKAFSHLCYSDIQYLYLARGLAEGVFPYTPVDDAPPSAQPHGADDQHQLSVEYPVLTGVWMGLAGIVTRMIGRNPDLSGVPHSDVQVNLDAQFDSAIFWGVNAVGFFILFLLALALLVAAQRRRPWDAMYIAAAPVVALTAMINWDMIAIAAVAGSFWAWSTRRPVLTGIFIGIGTATKLFPLFFLGPLLVLCFRERQMEAWVKAAAAALAAWLIIDLPVYFWSPDEFLWFWQFNASRGPDLGSVWGAALEYRHAVSSHTINLVTWVFFGACCVAVAALGLLAQRRPRLPQLIFLVTLAFLLVNKVYSPQYVLWLLPLAALARPRWRDLLIWQACEVFYFFAVWMHLAGFIVTEGDPDWFYVLAIAVRIAGELYLAVLVVRDILRPWHDPVRMDGLSDDPLGGVLDEGIDSEPPDPFDEREDERPPPVGVSTRPANGVDDADRDPIYAP